MTAWRTEQAAIENMISQFGGSMFACVMDSYDYAAVCLAAAAPRAACQEKQHPGHTQRALSLRVARLTVWRQQAAAASLCALLSASAGCS